MSFNPGYSSNIFSQFGQQVGQYNSYNGTLTLNQTVQDYYNPYRSIDPGTYGVVGNSVFDVSPMSPIGTIGPNSIQGTIGPNSILFPR